MDRNIVFFSMIALAGWVALVAIQIEALNARAGFYLPRHDIPPDSPWRVSRENSLRDQMRGVVGTVGLLQYVLAPVVLVLAGLQFKGAFGRRRVLVVCCGVVGLIALVLAFYRGYWPSLGD